MSGPSASSFVFSSSLVSFLGPGRPSYERANVKVIPIAGALCAAAVVFYSAYTRSYDGVGLVILLVFFTYFLNLKSGSGRAASLPSSSSGGVA